MATQLTTMAQSILIWSSSQIGIGIIVILLAFFLLRRIIKRAWGLVLVLGIFLVSKGIIDIAMVETVGKTAWQWIQTRV